MVLNHWICSFGTHFNKDDISNFDIFYLEYEMELAIVLFRKYGRERNSENIRS